MFLKIKLLKITFFRRGRKSSGRPDQVSAEGLGRPHEGRRSSKRETLDFQTTSERNGHYKR